MDKADATACDDLKTVTDIAPTEEANIHGIVSNVSPMKKGASPYFDANVCDTEKKVRLVGFTSMQRKRLCNFEDTMDPVALKNVKVKKAKNSEDLEVVLKSNSKLESSPVKFPNEKVYKLIANQIMLSDLNSRNDYDRVTIKAKVIKIDDPVKVSPTLHRQNITVADASAPAKLTLWENSIGTLTLDKSYKFCKFAVHTFRSEKYLSEPKEGASVEEIDDIGEVAEDDLPEDTVTIEGVTVAAATISEYSSCVACNSKVEPLQSNTQIAQCTKCSLQQLTTTARQHTSANLLINVGVEYMQLTAFNNILQQIVNGREISVVGLLMAPRFNMTYDGKVIVSISRPPSQ